MRSECPWCTTIAPSPNGKNYHDDTSGWELSHWADSESRLRHQRDPILTRVASDLAQKCCFAPPTPTALVSWSPAPSDSDVRQGDIVSTNCDGPERLVPRRAECHERPPAERPDRIARVRVSTAHPRRRPRRLRGCRSRAPGCPRGRPGVQADVLDPTGPRSLRTGAHAVVMAV